jgi:hypothetical protein
MVKLRTKLEKTTIPCLVLVGEARLMYEWCQSDKNEFESFGFNWETVNTIPALCNESQNLFVQLQIENITLEQYKRDLAKRFYEATKMRTVVSERIRYALQIAESDKHFPGYSRRRDYMEIIGDLLNLAGFCEQFKDILEKIGFNQQKAEDIKLLAIQLQTENVTLYSRVLENKDLKKKYLSAYHDLYNLVQLLRKCAFEIFPPDSPRRNGYQSQYRKVHK